MTAQQLGGDIAAAGHRHFGAGAAGRLRRERDGRLDARKRRLPHPFQPPISRRTSWWRARRCAVETGVMDTHALSTVSRPAPPSLTSWRACMPAPSPPWPQVERANPQRRQHRCAALAGPRTCPTRSADFDASFYSELLRALKHAAGQRRPGLSGGAPQGLHRRHPGPDRCPGRGAVARHRQLRAAIERDDAHQRRGLACAGGCGRPARQHRHLHDSAATASRRPDARWIVELDGKVEAPWQSIETSARRQRPAAGVTGAIAEANRRLFRRLSRPARPRAATSWKARRR